MDTVREFPEDMSHEQNRRISQVVRDSGKRLLGYIRARVASDADAEDVLQDVWQQLVTSLNVGPIEQVGAWLYTVARNRIIDRARKPKMASLDELVEDLDDEGDSGFDFGTFLLRDEKNPRTEHLRTQFWEQLQAALAELPEAQRQVFIWHEFEALSFLEISELTGEKVNTLLARKRYAVLHLRARLEPLRRDLLVRQL